MQPTLNPRVKICCISSVEEDVMAIEVGASALGLVSQMPSGLGVVSDELIAEIAATVPPETFSPKRGRDHRAAARLPHEHIGRCSH